MAMTPQGWSLSALAVEFELDRRTVARRLADVRPIGGNGAKAWRLVDAAPALVGHERRTTGETLAEGRPLPDFFAGLASRVCAFSTPRVAAKTAFELGLGAETAFRLFEACRPAMHDHVIRMALRQQSAVATYNIDGIPVSVYCVPVDAPLRRAAAPTATVSNGASENRAANSPILSLGKVR